MQDTLIRFGARTLCALTLTGIVATSTDAAAEQPYEPKYKKSRKARQNIAEIAVATPDLSILVEALGRAGLVETVATEGPFTVFAPTNQAFLDLLAALNLSSLDDVPTDVLTDILLDHVVVGTNRSGRLARFDRSDRELVALGGLALDFDRDPVEVNDINVSIADIRASNGIIHVIDAVLLEPDPRPTITELAVGNPDLSVLVAAVQRTGLDQVLNNGKPFTVFAPTNQAFLDLLAALGLSSLDEVDDRTLTNILLDHIVSDELDAIDVLERVGKTRGAKALGDLRLRFENKPLTVNEANIIAVDVEAENGTVHVIDTVLLD